VSPSAVTMWGFRRTAIIIAAVLIVIVLTLVAVRRVGPWAPEPWRNVKTGRTAGPGFVGQDVPYESSDGCGSTNYADSISFLRGWYVQRWNGPDNMVAGTYDAEATLPPGAVFTGWIREGKRLFLDPADKRHGSYRYLYVATPDGVERWPRATFGCQ
jgi:hypothetical protein